MKKNCILSILFSLILISCATTNTTTEQAIKPKISYEVIDEYHIKITGVETIRNVFLCEPTPTWNSHYSLDDITRNIYIEVDGIPYNFFKDMGFFDPEEVTKFALQDYNGKKVEVNGNSEIDLYSILPLKYSNVIIGTGLEFKDVASFGNKRAPYDCFICFNILSFGDKTKEDKERLDLANQIIVKKYNFDSVLDYKQYLNRTYYQNLYNSLSIGSYSNYIPFKTGDLIFVPDKILTVKDVEPALGAYLYLISAYGSSAISECCFIVSEHQLQYVNYDYNEALILESMLLEYQGKNEYQQGYSIKTGNVFKLIEPNDPKYQNYREKTKEMADIERYPNKYLDILE